MFVGIIVLLIWRICCCFFYRIDIILRGILVMCKVYMSVVVVGNGRKLFGLL